MAVRYRLNVEKEPPPDEAQPPIESSTSHACMLWAKLWVDAPEFLLTTVTQRDERELVTAPQRYQLGNRGMQKEKGRGTLQTSASCRAVFHCSRTLTVELPCHRRNVVRLLARWS